MIFAVRENTVAMEELGALELALLNEIAPPALSPRSAFTPAEPTEVIEPGASLSTYLAGFSNLLACCSCSAKLKFLTAAI